jgi:hypothetical protein
VVTKDADRMDIGQRGTALVDADQTASPINTTIK